MAREKSERLEIRLDPKLKSGMRAYVKRHHTTLARIIEKHLRELLAQERQITVVVETGDAEQI